VWQPKSRKNLGELLAEVCAQFAVTEAALRSRSSQRQLTRARAWMAHQAISLRIASLCEVARLFQRRESSLREGSRDIFSVAEF
jgi:chromosomal replication initiation ATPase DnaA